MPKETPTTAKPATPTRIDPACDQSVAAGPAVSTIQLCPGVGGPITGEPRARHVDAPEAPVRGHLGGAYSMVWPVWLWTRKRRMVAWPDRLLLSGSRSVLASPGAEKWIPS